MRKLLTVEKSVAKHRISQRGGQRTRWIDPSGVENGLPVLYVAMNYRLNSQSSILHNRKVKFGEGTSAGDGIISLRIRYL